MSCCTTAAKLGQPSHVHCRETNRESQRHTKSVTAASYEEIGERLIFVCERRAGNVERRSERVAVRWSNVAVSSLRKSVGCEREWALRVQRFTWTVHLSTHTTQLLMPWLRAKYNYFEKILKLFQCFISHVTTSETETKLFQSDVD